MLFLIYWLKWPYAVDLCLHGECQVIRHNKFTVMKKEENLFQPKWREMAQKELCHYIAGKAFQMNVFYGNKTAKKKILDLYHWTSCEWVGNRWVYEVLGECHCISISKVSNCEKPWPLPYIESWDVEVVCWICNI